MLCYANFCLCDVASHVLDIFSWCCAYCQCPFVRIIVLSLWLPCCLFTSVCITEHQLWRIYNNTWRWPREAETCRRLIENKKWMCYIDGQNNKYSVLNECNRMLKYNIQYMQIFCNYLRWFHIEHLCDAPLHYKKMGIVHVELNWTEEILHSTVLDIWTVDKILVLASCHNLKITNLSTWSTSPLIFSLFS
jgi:hypothetical protein